MTEGPSEGMMAEDTLRHEEDDDDEGDWEDWNTGAQQEGGDAITEDDDEGENLASCLFCSLQFPSADDAFTHCASSHDFDFHKLRSQLKLDFYDSIRIINYIRKLVSSNVCIFCTEVFTTREALLSHMEKTGHTKLPEEKVEGSEGQGGCLSLPWNNDEYLTPVLEDDPLLYSFEGDDEDTFVADVPVIIPESNMADLESDYEKQLLMELAESGEGPSDLQIRNEQVATGEANTNQFSFESQNKQSTFDSKGQSFLAAQELADEILALRLENEDLKNEIAKMRENTQSSRLPPRSTPTPHPTPAGSPFRQPVKEGTLSALEPPHTLQSLQKIGEKETEDIDMLEEADVADGEPMETEGRNSQLAENIERMSMNDGYEKQEAASEVEKRKGKLKGPKGKVSFAAVAEKEAQGVDSSYFNSYGQFGIHREMLSDKVRTDAYRAALVDNPSLLKDAVVMDVGCGTGILSLFAAQGGASKVVAVDASQKIASIARQVAQSNGYLASTSSSTPSPSPSSSSSGRPVISVVVGKVEDLKEQETADEKPEESKKGLSAASLVPVKEKTVDVLVSEWMGYCLLFESMLSSVLRARDKWLKPGGAVLPDIATMYVAGFGKGGTSVPFWEDVYGFNMSVVGQEVMEDSSQVPIVDVVAEKDVITPPCLIQSFDISTMEHDDVDFTSFFHLELSSDESSSQVKETSVEATTEACYGLVVWFDVEFSKRFCSDKPVVMSTSPMGTPTHWSQTKLTLKDPIRLSRSRVNQSGSAWKKETETVVSSSDSLPVKRELIGTDTEPAVAINGRISIARSARHRSIDISLETAAVARDGTVRRWPVQMFDI